MGKNRRQGGNLAPKSAIFDTFYPKLCKFLQFSPKFAQILTFFPKICANFDNFYPKFCKFWQFLPKKGGKLFQRIFACGEKIKFCGRIFTYEPAVGFHAERAAVVQVSNLLLHSACSQPVTTQQQHACKFCVNNLTSDSSARLRDVRSHAKPDAS